MFNVRSSVLKTLTPLVKLSSRKSFQKMSFCIHTVIFENLHFTR